MKTFALLLLLCTLGCQSTPPPPKIVNFDSEPPGARVFIGMGPNEEDARKTRNYLGQTPMQWTVPEEMMAGRQYFRAPGTFVYSEFVPSATVFFADPPAGHTNLYPQSQVFHSGTHFKQGHRIPVGVFFDLTKPKN